MSLVLNKYITVGIAVLLLMLGKGILQRVPLLKKYCIPAPVVGGLVFSIINFILRVTNILTIELDFSLQEFFMVVFFTSVGFSASLKTLKLGGFQVFKFLFIAVGLVFLQNGLSILLAGPVGIDPMLAMLTGSTPLTGGLGTSAAIAPIIEARGVQGAHTVAITSATFAMIMGSIIGGPIADKLIKKHDLYKKKLATKDMFFDESAISKDSKFLNKDLLSYGVFIILIAVGIGMVFTYGINFLVGLIIKDISFPIYIGPMIVAAILRNIFDSWDNHHTPMHEVEASGDIALNIFLGLALMNLKLWELINLALPIFILLAAQTLLMIIYAYTVSFKVMGKTYDSAVIASGFCGFGMGAVANGMANMSAVCEKYTYSKLAFFVIPIVGSLFIDFLNVIIITTTLVFI